MNSIILRVKDSETVVRDLRLITDKARLEHHDSLPDDEGVREIADDASRNILRAVIDDLVIRIEPDIHQEEFIKHAAILYDGIPYVGRDHYRIINDVMTPMGLNNLLTPGSVENQGFITNTGRFVGRREAAQIAFKAGQLHDPKRILFSEDLNYPKLRDGLPFRSEWNWEFKPSTEGVANGEST